MLLPVINVNKGTLVDWCGVARAAISTRGSLISLIDRHVLLQHADHVPVGPFNLTHGNWVMAYMELGLYTQEFPHFLHDFSSEVGLRSELTLKCSPNLEKMWFINRQAVVSAVSLGAGRHFIHFMNSQTTVRKYLLPHVDHFRGPTQSIWRSDHGEVIPFLCSGARRFGFVGWNWQHTRHPFTYSVTSCCMSDQYATCLSVS